MISGLAQRLGAIRSQSAQLRRVDPARKNAALLKLASDLVTQSEIVLRANQEDLASLPQEATAAFRDRLMLSPARISAMAESLRQVAALPDPVGEVVETKTLENGLRARRVRSPLGVILLIFESRPNVAIEAFSLAFKSGNAVILRGGRDSMRTTDALYTLIGSALESQLLSPECCWGVTDPDRELVRSLLQEKAYIDVVVPRGSDRLIEFVVKNSLIPIIKNDRGLCHVYVHEDADLGMAERIVENAKTHRPGVCNAMETLLVHSSVAQALLPSLHSRLSAKRVKWHGCPRTKTLLAGAKDVVPAELPDWDVEYLDLKMNCRVVDSLDEAIAHIERHGSRHSEAIVTASREAAERFIGEVDAAAVYWNASTRFTDGFELGLGGELGISTQKLHVRGPVGLRELTSVRWIIEGEGQVRK